LGLGKGREIEKKGIMGHTENKRRKKRGFLKAGKFHNNPNNPISRRGGRMIAVRGERVKESKGSVEEG